MAYDNSSLTGDEICDYHYDIENNFMNPPSSTGFFIYKVIGGAFDWLGNLITQFRIDYSILDCNVGDVEIVNGFPEEPNTNHTYYVTNYTSSGGSFTKYSFVDGEWVSETVTGDVLNSLDVFWGKSYNLTRPKIHHSKVILFEDVGTLENHINGYVQAQNTVIVTRYSGYTKLQGGTANQNVLKIDVDLGTDFQIDFNYGVGDARARQSFNIVNENNTTYSVIPYTSSTSQNIINLGIANNCHITISKIGDTLKAFADGVEKGSLGVTGSKFNFTFGFTNTNPFFYFSNLVIIDKSENSLQDLTDEEYRIYLYLKNHQLLTMKDLLVAFTNAFGSAETSTTILNSIHTVDHKTYDNPIFTNDTLEAYDDEDMDIVTDKLVDKEGVNLITDRLAQGTTSILIPDDGWDEQFLRFLESFISIKGNILISVGG